MTRRRIGLDPVWVLRTLYGGWVAGGVAILASVLIPSWDPSLALAALPDLWQIGLGGVLAAGGIAAMAGTVRRRARMDRSWAVERAGLTLSAVAWGAYTLVIVVHRPAGVISWGTAAVTVAVCLVRLAVVDSRDRVVTGVVRTDMAAAEAAAAEDDRTTDE